MRDLLWPPKKGEGMIVSVATRALEVPLFAEYGNRMRDFLLDYHLRAGLTGRHGL